METIYWVILAIVVWWTFAVAVFGIMLGADDANSDWKGIGIATVWPLMVLPVIIALVYDMSVASTSRIRRDLHNRKVLREFDQWLAQRPKD